MSPAWQRFATCSFGLLASYVLLVCTLGETLAGIRLGTVHLAVATGLCLLGAGWLTRRLARSGAVSSRLLGNLAVASAALLAALLAADILYAVARNRRPVYRADAATERYGDPVNWCRRLNPPFYWPTERNFRLFKAGVRIEGDCEGDLFDPLLAERFPELAAQIAEPRRIVHSIDAHGFRDTTPLATARTFALGDSFAFGYGVSQESGWVERLERLTGTPIYNLGITDTSPRQQLLLLRHLLSEEPELRLSHLLWMIFEGNDLEDSSADERPPIARYGAVERRLVAGTVLEDLLALPWSLQRQSMLHALLEGRLGAPRPRLADRRGPSEYGGLLLRRPLYHSERFGWRFFEPRYIERAARPVSYVRSHPNRPALDRTLEAMADLARRRGFRVTVVLVPTAPRLYAPYFDGITVSERAHFLEHVGERAAALGFAVVDLHALLLPHAARELLYWRDDSHWNARGNELAAELIAQHVAASR